MAFFGTVAERVFWKQIQSTETYTNLLNAALWIFFHKTRSVMVPRFGFVQGSRIRVNSYIQKICHEIIILQALLSLDQNAVTHGSREMRLLNIEKYFLLNFPFIFGQIPFSFGFSFGCFSFSKVSIF